ncbi:MAG: NAD(P)/FAD-dependent oxidoreductase [Bacteroidia bacterium]|nr:NAD(P)/FAD-dependent oxidoreductase [Bacteroidia bacterium]
METRSINRKQFIVLISSFFGAGILWAFFKRFFTPKAKSPSVVRTQPDAKTGHLVRQNIDAHKSNKPSVPIAIIGGGISGMVAAWWLKKNHFNEFVLYELESNTGGNSSAHKNESGMYPLGAHYLPIPNTNQPELLEFLEEINCITGWQNKLPIYNEYQLCLHPKEALYIRGVWQGELIPTYGLNENEIKQNEKFNAKMQAFSVLKGKDGKEAFTIPMAHCSTDPEILELDKISMKNWMLQQGLNAPHLLWYVDYCCSDDFGANSSLVSAWAGIHYFTSRKGRGANSNAEQVLTWPQGNGFLAEALRSKISAHIQPNMLGYGVEKKENNWNISLFDKNKNSHFLQNANAVILAVPSFVRQHLYKNNASFPSNYHPWLVDTIQLKAEFFEEQKPAWDNVLYGSPSLGYIFNGHQETALPVQNRNITFFHAFSSQNPAETRKYLENSSNQHLLSGVLRDLEKMHLNITQQIISHHLHIWGHGMVSPGINSLWNPKRIESQKAPLRMAFAHTDISGISIFEEGFYQGIQAANKILKEL